MDVPQSAHPSSGCRTGARLRSGRITNTAASHMRVQASVWVSVGVSPQLRGGVRALKSGVRDPQGSSQSGHVALEPRNALGMRKSSRESLPCPTLWTNASRRDHPILPFQPTLCHKLKRFQCPAGPGWLRLSLAAVLMMTAMIQQSQGIAEPQCGTATHAGHFLWASQQKKDPSRSLSSASHQSGRRFPGQLPRHRPVACPLPASCSRPGRCWPGPGQLSPATVPEGAGLFCTSV